MRADLEQGIHTVLHHGGYILGPEVKKLEQSLAEFAQVEHCLSCASGTDALQLAMMALEIGPGDAVFVPAFTFMASAETVSLLGAEPRFVDIDQATFNMAPESLEAEINLCLQEGRLKPRCVMPVDLFGLPADYPAIRRITDRYGLTLLADSAQGLGGTLQGVMAASMADITATSFFPAKPLGCYGDGGAVFTADRALADRIASLRVHGKGEDKYDNIRIGINSRLDTLQAAILLAKLTQFPQELLKRRQMAKAYDLRLAGHVTTPHIPAGAESAWAQYGILSDHRDGLEQALRQTGIPTAIYYPKPLPFQTAYAGLGHSPGRFPVSEAVSRRILHLPMHPDLTSSEIDRIAEAIVRALGSAP
ncbi:MAG: DegT/DnrJ/EryC1/StrS family aminotransferase [Magnetococcales bacterium]|nr:DegT/DnrJ/EryC1/StrS family aminotransferase [Magnetococcales bacterium]